MKVNEVIQCYNAMQEEKQNDKGRKANKSFTILRSHNIYHSTKSNMFFVIG